MKNITIVTAFYDIGRDLWNNYGRKTSTYFECFKLLCQLKNKIIVFSEEKFRPYFDEIIENYKSDLIVFYQDIIKTNTELISNIKKSQLNLQRIGGLDDNGNPPEYWSPEYVLVNFLKSQFCISAIEKVTDIDEIVAWIDFGYLKKQEQIPESKLWNYQFSDKIHLWSIKNIPKQIDLLYTIRSNTVYIQGCHIVATKNKWYKLNELINKQLSTLLSNNLVDDDQTLLLMSYASEPENFKIYNETINYQDLGWFFILQYYNDFTNLKQKIA
jgi:protein YibB